MGEIKWNHVPFIHTSKTLDETRYLIGYGDGLACRAFNAPCLDIIQAARDDLVEPVAWLVCHVECETMRRQSVADLDAYAGDLGVRIEEDTGVLRGRKGEAMGFTEMELEGLLHATDVVPSAHDRVVTGEVEEGVSDDLPGTVIGQLATSRRGDKVGAEGGEADAVRVELCVCLATACGVDWTMLEKEEEVIVVCGLAEGELETMESVLKMPCGEIRQGGTEKVEENGREGHMSENGRKEGMVIGRGRESEVDGAYLWR